MGKMKNAMLAWMEEQGISQNDLEEMDNINEQFSAWLSNRITGKETPQTE